MKAEVIPAPMGSEDVEHFRGLLEERLAGLLDSADQTARGMSGGRELFPDPTDRASLESSRNFDLRIRDRERKLLKKIREALQRIEDGEFGICEECGLPISVGRLRARPVTTLCIDCKAEQEADEGKLSRGC